MADNHKQKKRRWRYISGVLIILLGGALCLQTMRSSHVSAAETNALPPSRDIIDIASLMLGPSEMPKDVVLMGFETYPTSRPWTYYSMGWSGLRTSQPEESAHYSYTIRVTIADSPAQAMQIVERERRSVAVSPQEVTAPDNPLSKLGDTVWDGKSYKNNTRLIAERVLFVIGYIVCDVHASDVDGLDKSAFLLLAERLKTRVQSALAGHPLSPPILPPAADDDMHTDLENAWAIRNATNAILKVGTTIAVQVGDGLPRALPALPTVPNDYVVPLRPLIGLLGMRLTPEGRGQAVSVSLGEKKLVLTPGQEQVLINDQPVTVNRPLEYVEGQLMVPLSVMELLDIHIQGIPLVQIQLPVPPATP